MSQYPPPAGPMPYATPDVPQPGRRPTSVTVIAIISIIWGSLGLLGGLCTIPQYLGVQLAPNPVMDAVRNDPFVLGFTLAAMVLNVVMAAVLLVAGVGALLVKPWARTTMVVYALIQIAVAVVTTPLNFLAIYPRMERDLQSMAQSNPAVLTGMKAGVYGGILGTALVVLWAVLILYFMSRPHVKSAFGEQV